jgi:NADH-quinone oxidoreductase subunit E
MFNLAPVGRFHVQMCGTTPCVLRGADKLIEICHHRIGDQFEVTDDGKFSWVEVECLGACVNAPMAQINYDFYEDLTPDNFNKLLDEMAAGKTPKPGPQIDRQFSAPQGGATTLLDEALYTRTRTQPGPALTDESAKKPGAAANVREAAVPKEPVGDSSGKRKKSCSRTRIAFSPISTACMTGASKARGRAAAGTARKRSSTKAVTPSSTK